MASRGAGKGNWNRWRANGWDLVRPGCGFMRVRGKRPELIAHASWASLTLVVASRACVGSDREWDSGRQPRSACPAAARFLSPPSHSGGGLGMGASFEGGCRDGASLNRRVLSILMPMQNPQRS